MFVWDLLPHAGASQIHPHIHGFLDTDRYQGWYIVILWFYMTCIYYVTIMVAGMIWLFFTYLNDFSYISVKKILNGSEQSEQVNISCLKGHVDGFTYFFFFNDFQLFYFLTRIIHVEQNRIIIRLR